MESLPLKSPKFAPVCLCPDTCLSQSADFVFDCAPSTFLSNSSLHEWLLPGLSGNTHPFRSASGPKRRTLSTVTVKECQRPGYKRFSKTRSFTFKWHVLRWHRTNEYVGLCVRSHQKESDDRHGDPTSSLLSVDGCMGFCRWERRKLDGSSLRNIPFVGSVDVLFSTLQLIEVTNNMTISMNSKREKTMVDDDPHKMARPLEQNCEAKLLP